MNLWEIKICSVSRQLTEQHCLFPREEREELIKIARDKASEEICLMVLNEGVLIELQNLALEVLDEKKAERDSKLHQLAVKVKRSRTARYFSRYKIL